MPSGIAPVMGVLFIGFRSPSSSVISRAKSPNLLEDGFLSCIGVFSASSRFCNLKRAWLFHRSAIDHAAFAL